MILWYGVQARTQAEFRALCVADETNLGGPL